MFVHVVLPLAGLLSSLIVFDYNTLKQVRKSILCNTIIRAAC